jgi:hypothetical protein
MDLFNNIAFDNTMEIQKWNKRDIIFEGNLDSVYQGLDH